ncbi:MAG: NADP-dependent malic enzyme [Gammaproteobacteria bacterium]|nr:MAG: NADP-dependent malic enzyme [Gammaproteobacteria bacterium]
MSKDSLYEEALYYHRNPKPGKLAIHATKPLTSQHDLSLAYSPGVAAACEVIVKNPAEAATVTSRSNLVAVISNGTAVLGLGDIGPLAAKPVMEGKAVLFKAFADVDVFDIEIDEKDPDRLVDIIEKLAPTFGGINLEDIGAPECFEVEKKLTERLSIPVFHDDQHGTAIISSAALINALDIAGKRIDQIKMVCSGAGAAGIACLNLMIKLGLKRKNIIVCDSRGVIYKGREQGIDATKQAFAVETEARTLADAIKGADAFLGVSVGGVLKPEMVAEMADNPVILAMANPTPEIMPDAAKKVRPDCIVATGRSDFPNQVNNVLCFPFMFRGALDCGASGISDEMQMAAVHALAELAREPVSDIVAKAYGGKKLKFGPEYILPTPFDPRLMAIVPPAIAQAAMDSGVATRPIADMKAYRDQLMQSVYRSASIMKEVFQVASQVEKKVIYPEGSDERVLRAIQILGRETSIQPVLVAKRQEVLDRLAELGLKMKEGEDFQIVDPEQMDFTTLEGDLNSQSDTTVIASHMLKTGQVDAMVAGPAGSFRDHLNTVEDIIGVQQDTVPAAMQLLITEKGAWFMTDTYVNYDPDAEQLAAITMEAAEQIKLFGITPKVALVSHSSYGNDDSPSARKMRKAVELIRQRDADFEVDGEMQSHAALACNLRELLAPDSAICGDINLLVMPNLDAANIAFNALRILGDGVAVGPILLGLRKPAHILSSTATTRGVVNISAIAAACAICRS